MKFIITRTSGADFGTEPKPVKNAEKEIVDDEERWVCKIKTLEALIVLAHDLDDYLIVKSHSPYPKIEIYDGWRE